MPIYNLESFYQDSGLVFGEGRKESAIVRGQITVDTNNPQPNGDRYLYYLLLSREIQTKNITPGTIIVFDGKNGYEVKSIH